MRITIKHFGIFCGVGLVLFLLVGIISNPLFASIAVTNRSLSEGNLEAIQWALEDGNQTFSVNGVILVDDGKIVNKEAAINYVLRDRIYTMTSDEAVAAINALEAQYGSASSASNTTTAPAKEEPTESSSTTSTESATASQSTSSESVAQQETKTETKSKETKETKTETESSTSKKEKEETAPSYTEEELEAAWEETRRVEPTCTEAGEVTYTCDMCGKTKTETLNPAGHQPEEVSSKANLFTSSTKVTKCSVCGEVISEDKVPATIPLPVVIVVVLALGGLIAGVIIKKRYK